MGIRAKFQGHRPFVESAPDLREDESIQNLIDDASDGNAIRPFDILSLASAGGDKPNLSMVPANRRESGYD